MNRILNRIIKIRNKYYEKAMLKQICFCGMKFYLAPKQKVEFWWIDEFKKYFSENDMDKKIEELKAGMDKISCDYIDNFIRLTNYWGWQPYAKKIWTDYDEILIEKAQNSMTRCEQPYPNLLWINDFMLTNMYGMSDLPKEVLESINGKDIIDGGGFNGDTALLFNNFFPDSKIYVYEPLSVNINKLYDIVKEGNLEDKIIPIKKGLGDKHEVKEIIFNVAEIADITTLDHEFKGNNIGLIKLDTEGFETQIIEGGAELIKRKKPVLAIAMYHSPYDFFELRTKLSDLNPDYKFMIRRSENILPQADLVLIAY